MKVKCLEPMCANVVAKDGYCKGHWDFYFTGMTNKQRMAEKRKLRELRREPATT